MRLLILALAVGLCTVSTQAEAGPELRVDFSNPGLTPSNWTLTVHPDGSGHFHSDRGQILPGSSQTIEPAGIDRDVRLSEDFAGRAFATAHRRKLFIEGCESHMKVAFQGWKKFTYEGPDGKGSCEFNYSKTHEIQDLGDSFVAVASTIIEGARLELLLQHDPLGLDKEMEYLTEAVGDGRVQQLCAIRGILQKLEDDPDVMERVRRRASALLAQSTK